MYKQSPSRNHRSKGIKVKHILQICVLVAVCFWLLYQVKRSHEKRKEFESKDENSVAKLQSDNELQRFGRKDIPKVTEIATNIEKHEEDEDDKEDEEDKDNKHEDDETEREDARSAEIEEERGGDDEIDQHESEKAEDEDKEREEKESVADEIRTENEEHEDTHEKGHPEEEEEESGKENHIEFGKSDDVDKEDHGEREIKSNDHDHDVEKNTREAKEELYRADDASSEVAQNIQSNIQENGNVTMGQANEIYRKINFGQEHETETFKNADEMMKPNIQLKEDVNSTASNATITEQKDNKVNLTTGDDVSLQNSTLPEIPNNSSVGGGNLAVNLPSNGTQTTLDSDLSRNGTIRIKQTTYDENQKVPGEDVNDIVNVNTNKTLALSDDIKDNEPVETAKHSLGGDESQGEKPEDNGKAGADKNVESLSSKDRETIQHDPIDASDTLILTKEEKESRTDLDTLPEIRSEGHDTEGAVAE